MISTMLPEKAQIPTTFKSVMKQRKSSIQSECVIHVPLNCITMQVQISSSDVLVYVYSSYLNTFKS